MFTINRNLWSWLDFYKIEVTFLKILIAFKFKLKSLLKILLGFD